jgi:flavin-dependent dehydrogenase
VLQQAGFDVLVMDKSSFPRDKVCAGWITPEVVNELTLDLEDYRQHHTLQAFSGFRTGMLGLELVSTDYGKTVSYGIRRCEFDDYLLKRSGAKLRLGEALSSLEREQDEWLINHNFRTPLLIGAGGHFCPVARHLNPKANDHHELVTAQEMEFEMTTAQQADCKVQAETPELYFLPELDGYGWCVRKGDFLNIGLGRTENHHLSRYVNRFYRYLVAQGKVPADAPQRFRGHAYRLATSRNQRQLVDDGVMLVGDAAGLAYPQSGEGIYTAIKSGLLAAQTVIESQGEYSLDSLKQYPHKLDQFFDDQKPFSVDRLWIPKTLRLLMARILLTSRYLSRRILLDKWFLHGQGSSSG